MCRMLTLRWWHADIVMSRYSIVHAPSLKSMMATNSCWLTRDFCLAQLLAVLMDAMLQV